MLQAWGKAALADFKLLPFGASGAGWIRTMRQGPLAEFAGRRPFTEARGWIRQVPRGCTY